MNIDINVNEKTIPNRKMWQFCVGSCHAALAHRADYRKQLKFIHDELGIKRVRMHGLFCDDMNTIQSMSDFLPLPGADKSRTQSFYQIGEIFDGILEAGMQPFVEVGFMPSKLASGKKNLPFHYKGNITMPKDMEKWQQYIMDFVQYLIHRYGKEEIEQWYFEIWNEPDLSAFFAGTKADYFKLYQATVEAIKKVDEKIQVGGPSTSNNLWIPEFLDYCKKNSVPVDFVSTHQYPGAALGHAVSFTAIKRMLKNVKLTAGMSANAGIRTTLYNEEDRKLMIKGELTEQVKKARKEAGDMPLFYTEWNCSSTCTAPILDTKVAASFDIKTMIDNDTYVEGASMWTFSDIFEELQFFPETFSGSFGLQTIQGIPKPSFYAFKMLSELGDERLEIKESGENTEIAVYKKENQLQIVLYWSEYYDKEATPETIALKLNCPTVKSVTIQKIDDTHCNPKKVWEEMGSPKDLRKDEVEKIKKDSQLLCEEIPYEQKDGMVNINTKVGVNNVQLITITM